MLYRVEMQGRGGPVAREDDVARLLGEVFGDSGLRFEAVDPDAGLWRVELPDEYAEAFEETGGLRLQGVYGENLLVGTAREE